jgi:hypothetical protein
VFQSGYLSIGRWRGALVRLHWSILLGAVVFGGFRFDPVYLAGFVVLVLIHEFGHAFVVWRFGHSVSVIEATGFGGTCHWSGNATPFEEAAIAWGGVLAQALVLALAYAWLALQGPPASEAGWTLTQLATRTNLWLIAVNLMPVPPLDGARAWQIFGLWRERRSPRVPHGSWHDPTPLAQRTWLERLWRRSKPRRARPQKREDFGDPPDLERELSPEAKRALDDMLKRIRQGKKDEV